MRVLLANLARVATALVAAALVGLPAQASTMTANPSAKIRGFANQWMGTPYVWGGDSKGGIDCSAYLRQMFRELFDVELPRTTHDQIGLGTDVGVRAEGLDRTLQPGDLIFYIDSAGVPNHVVVYVGNGQLTHSVSGRGVVIDPLRQLWGRRIVVRRVLVPSGRSGGYGPIPPGGPIVPKEIPCPASIVARAGEVRALSARPVDIKALGEREICDFRALAKALRASGTPIGAKNADALSQHAIWLEDIEALQGSMLPKR